MLKQVVRTQEESMETHAVHLSTIIHGLTHPQDAIPERIKDRLIMVVQELYQTGGVQILCMQTV
jgi:hypothetical protein